MGYSLGVDLGATSCAAAFRRGPGVEPCALGEIAPTMPTVVLPRNDGSMLVGEVADQRCRYEPPLVARRVADGLGQPDPVEVDGEPVDPVALAEALLGTIVERASAGDDWPGHLVLTFPLRRGGDVEPVLEQAAARVTTSPVMLLPEPIAAMAKLAHDVELALDTTVAVVDFGGSSFDVTLVRRTATGFDLIGEPASLADFGGIDVDAAVLAHVESVVGDVTSAVRDDDLAGMMALRQLRASCRAAKEQLSTVDETLVDVELPQVRTQVPITRRDLERAIEPRLTAGVDLVASTLADAGLGTADVHVALLVGGSSRMPLLTKLVTDRIGLPIVADPLPELTVSLGAAMFGEEDPAAAMPAVATEPQDAPPAPAAPADVEPVVGAPLDPWPGESEPWRAEDTWDPVGTPLAPTAAGAAALGPAGGGTTWEPPEESWDRQPWDDDRVSIFGSLEPVPPGPPDTSQLGHEPDGADEAYSRLTTSDSDPFGTRSATPGGWLARQRRAEAERRAEQASGEDGDVGLGEDRRRGGYGGSTDPRVVIAAIGAGLIIVLLGGFALAAGTGRSDDNIAVGNNDLLTTTTELSTSSDGPGTTHDPTTSTTVASDTTTGSQPSATRTTGRSRHGTTSTTASWPTGSPPATSPPTNPPPSPPRTTPTTTRPRTTTTTSTTTTSTTTTTTPPTTPPTT